MNKLRIGLLYLLLCTSCASHVKRQELISIHTVDHHGFTETISNKERLNKMSEIDYLAPQPYEKVVRIYRSQKEEGSHTFLTSYYNGGQPHQYLEAVNSVAQGFYREWHPNGRLKLEARVIGGNAELNPSAQQSWIFEDFCKVFDDEGALIAEIPYAKGVLQGTVLYYHPSGGIAKKMPYDKGVLDGLLEIFDCSGRLIQQTAYEKGVQEGLGWALWPDGSLLLEERWRCGLLYSGRYFDTDGSLLCKIDEGFGEKALFENGCLREICQYVQGKQEGKVKVFDENRTLKSAYSLKDGLKHGEEIHYATSPKGMPPLKTQVPTLMLTWQKGMLHGLVRSWYENGVLESQREWSQNRKNGLCTAWYRDGSTMFIEEYNNDALMQGQYYRPRQMMPICQVAEGKGVAALFDGDGVLLHYVDYRDGFPYSP